MFEGPLCIAQASLLLLWGNDYMTHLVNLWNWITPTIRAFLTIKRMAFRTSKLSALESSKQWVDDSLSHILKIWVLQIRWEEFLRYPLTFKLKIFLICTFKVGPQSNFFLEFVWLLLVFFLVLVEKMYSSRKYSNKLSPIVQILVMYSN